MTVYFNTLQNANIWSYDEKTIITNIIGVNSI